MESELQALLAAILSAPRDNAPRRRLAGWLERRGDHRADEVWQHCETGSVYLRSYTLSGDGVKRSPSVAFLVLQLVPQPLAVEFGCRCADRVLRVFHREWPDDRRPEELLAAVRSWLRGEVTKKRVHQLAWAMADRVDDAAAQPPVGDTWNRGQEVQRYRAVGAARSAVNVAVAVSCRAASDQWVSDICEGAIEAMGASGSPARERTWQRRELLSLIRG